MKTSPQLSPPSPPSAEQDAGPSTAHGRHPWVLPLRLVVIAAALVGLYAALGFWVAPRAIKTQVVSQIAERYHRRAALGEVRFNPFTLRLEAERFKLPDADGQPMIGFDRLVVGLSASSLWRGGLALSEISLDAPRLRLVVRHDGRLNLEDLLPPASKSVRAEKPAKVMIDRLTVRRGHVDAIDLATGGAPFVTNFPRVHFTLDHFSTVQDGAAYTLGARTERGEHLAWRGAFGVSPLASNGTFAVTKVQLAPLWALAGAAAPFGLTRGELDLAGGYRFAMPGGRLALGIDLANARLTGAGLRAHGAASDWITLPLIDVSKVHIDVPGRTMSVGRIEAAGPMVDAWTERRGGLNLAAYVGASPAHAASAAGAEPGRPWKIDLPDLRVTGGRLAFEERSAARPVKLTAEPIDVAITGLALPIARPVQVDASVGLDDGGRLTAKGSVALDKLAAELDVGASDIGLPRLQPYIDETASLKLLSGRFSGQGHVSYVTNGAVRFSGAAQVDGLHTTDKILNQDFVNWRSLRVEGLDVRTKPLAVKIREVVAQQPYARVVIGPNYVMNVKTVLTTTTGVAAPRPPAPVVITPASSGPAPSEPAPTQPVPAAAPAKSAKGQALPIEIGLVSVENGEMDFSDLSIQPHFAAGIKKLGGTIKGLSGRQDARAVIDMTGQVDPYAPVKIDGQVNYFAARSYTDVRMDFQNMELTTFSPYSGKFAGYRINKGKLNVDLHYKIDDQKLNATHHVVINQLQLGDKVDSAEAVKLPVKLIVALLKDRNGVIDIPIEIDGTLDDPKFQVWPVIWHVVHNLLVKIATAPFTLLGKLVGGGEELQYVDFAPGGTTLDDVGRQKLAALAKALIERPAVNLEVPMPVDPQLDRPVLAEARFKAELADAAAELLGKRAAKPGGADAALAVPRTRRAILESLYRKEFGAKPEIPKPQAAQGAPKLDADQAADAWLEDKLRARIAVPEQALQQLGRARAEAVQAALLGDGQINPSRIFVITEPPRDAPQVRMTLSLS